MYADDTGIYAPAKDGEEAVKISTWNGRNHVNNVPTETDCEHKLSKSSCNTLPATYTKLISYAVNHLKPIWTFNLIISFYLALFLCHLVLVSCSYKTISPIKQPSQKFLSI